MASIEQANEAAAAGHDVKAAFGDISSSSVVQILALRPSIADLTDAAALLSGDRDVLARVGREPSAIAQQIADIVSDEFGEDEDDLGSA